MNEQAPASGCREAGGVLCLIVGLLGVGSFLVTLLSIDRQAASRDPAYAYGAGLGIQFLLPVLIIGIVLSFIGLALLLSGRRTKPSAAHLTGGATPATPGRGDQQPLPSSSERPATTESRFPEEPTLCPSCGRGVHVELMIGIVLGPGTPETYLCEECGHLLGVHGDGASDAGSSRSRGCAAGVGVLLLVLLALVLVVMWGYGQALRGFGPH